MTGIRTNRDALSEVGVPQMLLTVISCSTSSSLGQTSISAAAAACCAYITPSGGRPDGVMYAQQAAAAALIDVWPSDEEVLHEMTVSSIWGTPTSDSASRLVRIPVMTVRHRDGQRLQQMLEQGPVRIKLEAEVFTGPERITHPVASIPGTTEPERFLLVGGHIDSWYEG